MNGPGWFACRRTWTNGPGAIAFGRAPGIGVVGRTAVPCGAALAAFGGTGGRVMLAEDEDGFSLSSSLIGSSDHRPCLALCSLSPWGFSEALRFAFGISASLKPLGVVIVVSGSPIGTGSMRSIWVGHISSISTSLSASMKFGADACENKSFG